MADAGVTDGAAAAADAQVAAATTTIDPNLERKARQLGWLPKDQYRGPEDKWIDADAFVERGEQVMPFLRKANERLERQLQERDQRVTQAEARVAELQASIEELKKFRQQTHERQTLTDRGRLAAELRAAREAGDVEREVDIQIQINKLAVQPPESATSTAATTTTTATAAAPKREITSPEFLAWKAQNPWFDSDPVRRNLYLGMMQSMVDDGSIQRYGTQTERLEAAQEALDQVMGARREPPVSRVGTGRTNGTGATAATGGDISVNGHKYSELPAEAKKACEDGVAKLVGANKVFKTVDEWRTAYVRDYFSPPMLGRVAQR